MCVFFVYCVTLSLNSALFRLLIAYIFIMYTLYNRYWIPYTFYTYYPFIVFYWYCILYCIIQIYWISDRQCILYFVYIVCLYLFILCNVYVAHYIHILISLIIHIITTARGTPTAGTYFIVCQYLANKHETRLVWFWWNMAGLF